MSFKPGDTLYPFITFMGAIFIGIFLLRSINNIIKGSKSTSWLKHTATVNSTRIDKTPDDSDGFWYEPLITYQYKVSGSIITSNRLSYKNLISGEYSEALKYIAGLNKGDELDIYINQKRLNQSVIIPGTNWVNYFEAFFAVVFTMLLSYGMYEHLNM